MYTVLGVGSGLALIKHDDQKLLGDANVAKSVILNLIINRPTKKRNKKHRERQPWLRYQH